MRSSMKLGPPSGPILLQGVSNSATSLERPGSCLPDLTREMAEGSRSTNRGHTSPKANADPFLTRVSLLGLPCPTFLSRMVFRTYPICVTLSPAAERERLGFLAAVLLVQGPFQERNRREGTHLQVEGQSRA
jgi:hypothetical protein